MKRGTGAGWVIHSAEGGGRAGRHPGSGDVELKGANFMRCGYVFDYNYTSIHVANISAISNVFPPLPSTEPMR